MNRRVSFSLSPGTPLLQEKDTRRFIDLAKMADDYGAEAVGTHDTAFIGGDAYVRATLIALGSSRARVGLRPTNPLTREPQVMASFLASIDSLTGGRAFMDMASGDSAVLNIGYDVATRARIEDYVTCVRNLFTRGRGDVSGPAAAGPLGIHRDTPADSHLDLRRGPQDAAPGREDRRWRHRRHGTAAGRDPGHHRQGPRRRPRGRPQSIRRRHLVHDPNVTGRRSGSSDPGRQGLGVVDPEPVHAIRARRQARSRRAQGEDPGVRRRV